MALFNTAPRQAQARALSIRQGDPPDKSGCAGNARTCWAGGQGNATTVRQEGGSPLRFCRENGADHMAWPSIFKNRPDDAELRRRWRAKVRKRQARAG